MTERLKEYKEIPLNRIDADDDTFLVSHPRSDETLHRSIKRVGLINPLSLRSREGGKLQVIAGFRRLAACLEMGIEKVSAFIYPETLEPLAAFRIAVHDNLNRGYNLLEKSSILDKLVNLFHVPVEEVLHEYMPMLGLNPSRNLLRDYLSMKNLTLEMKHYIYETGVSLSSAARIASFGGKDQEALLKLIHPLRPGFGKLREILTHADEIAAREGLSIAEILCKGELTAVNDSDAPRTVKLEMVRSELKRMRYPALSSTENSVKELMKSLGLPMGLSLHLPPYLEGDTVSAELRFKSADELEALAKKILDISRRRELKKLLELL